MPNSSYNCAIITPDMATAQAAIISDPSASDCLRFYVAKCQMRDITDVQNEIEVLARAFGVSLESRG